MTPENSQSAKCPHLAVTLGDPAGIGPEVILKALGDASVTENCQLTVIGNRSLLVQTYQFLRSQPHLQGEVIANPEDLSILEVPLEDDTLSRIEQGRGNGASGKASFLYLEEGVKGALQEKFQGIVTGPIAKSGWKAAGYNYPGQTEMLAQAAGVDHFGMLFVARSPFSGWTLRTLLVTTHIPLNQVSQTLNPALMSLKLELFIDCLKRDFGIDHPEIVIAGLNPHSGEQGQLGNEEKDWLMPWLEEARKQYPAIQLTGLIPPDTMWVTPGQAWFNPDNNLTQKPADGYLALYHDQGLIPVKLMAFDQAINTTIGLPFIRTSPDHGTAFDIAKKGIAKASSMKEAIKLAAELSRQRLNNS